MKSIFSLSLLVAFSSAQAMSDFDKGRCEVLNFNTERECVELVCGMDSTIQDCKRSGDYPAIMGSCLPQLIRDAISGYNKRNLRAPLSCAGYVYESKF